MNQSTEITRSAGVKAPKRMAAVAAIVGLAALAGVSPGHADGPAVEPIQQLTLCPGADATGEDATFCVFDVPRAPDAPTFFIRKSGVKVTISPARAARKLTRWGWVLEDGFWRYHYH